MEIFKPKSIIDVGCGTGSWLKIFEEYGVENILGIDGEHLEVEKIVISPFKIQRLDLEKEIVLTKNFDLLICLEVAEHLTKERAGSFIADLAKISNIIVFSAALPFQGGQNHLNEQYINYWVDLFYQHGFIVNDILRPLIWNNNKIDWWYRQNIFVFKKSSDSFTEVNSLISKELYDLKIIEIELLQRKIKQIENGGMRFQYYLNKIWRKIKRKIL